MANSVAISLPLLTRTLRIASKVGATRFNLKRPAFLPHPNNYNQRSLVSLYNDPDFYASESAFPFSELLTKVTVDPAIDLRCSLEISLYPGSLVPAGQHKSLSVLKDFELLDLDLVRFTYNHITMYVFRRVVQKQGLELVTAINTLHRKCLSVKAKPKLSEKYTSLVLPVFDLDIQVKSEFIPLAMGLGLGEDNTVYRNASTFVRSIGGELSFCVHPSNSRVRDRPLIGTPFKDNPFIVDSPFTFWVVHGNSIVPQLIGVCHEDSFF